MTPHSPSSNGFASREALYTQIEEAWTQRHDIELPFQLARDNPDLADDLLDFFDRLVSMTIGPTPTDEQEEEVARRLQIRLRQTGRSHLADAIERVRSAIDPLAPLDESGLDAANTPSLTIDPSPTVPSSDGKSALSLEPTDSQWADVCKDYYDYAALHGHGPDEIANAFGLPVAVAHVLIINSEECPLLARQVMAQRGSDQLEGTSYDEGFRYLSGRQQQADQESAQGGYRYPKAASRSSGYSGGTTFSYEATIRNAPSSLSEEERTFWLALADDPVGS